MADLQYEMCFVPLWKTTNCKNKFTGNRQVFLFKLHFFFVLMVYNEVNVDWTVYWL